MRKMRTNINSLFQVISAESFKAASANESKRSSISEPFENEIIPRSIHALVDKKTKEFITKVSPSDKQVIIKLRDPTVNTNMFKTSLVDTTNNFNVPASIARQDLTITSIKMSTPDTKPRSKDLS